MFNEQHKKEHPILGLLGMGGGIARARSAAASGFSETWATGGYVSDYEISGTYYRAHLFLNSGSFTVSDSQLSSVDFLIVAGGGGGGCANPNSGHGGGGGGAGGMRSEPNRPVSTTGGPGSNGVYPVTVGTGGHAIKDGHPDSGNNGNPTTVVLDSPYSVTGGGGGGSRSTAEDGDPGGSGGGATTSGEAGGSTSYGNPGGEGPGSGGAGCGGGGAGEAGQSGPGPAGKSGGGGSPNNYLLGLPAPNPRNFYAAGGGGGAHDTGNGGSGGAGGGGGGGAGGPGTTIGLRGVPIPNNPRHVGKNGLQGTGSGGGGGGNGDTDPDGGGGAGGPGVCVIRYQIPESAGTAKATGGVITFSGGQTIHTFYQPGTFNASSPVTAKVSWIWSR